jgi:hypothetical protein
MSLQHPWALRGCVLDQQSALARGEVYASSLVLHPLVPSASLFLS